MPSKVYGEISQWVVETLETLGTMVDRTSRSISILENGKAKGPELKGLRNKLGMYKGRLDALHYFSQFFAVSSSSRTLRKSGG
jgi:hypothetical protein